MASGAPQADECRCVDSRPCRRESAREERRRECGALQGDGARERGEREGKAASPVAIRRTGSGESIEVTDPRHVLVALQRKCNCECERCGGEGFAWNQWLVVVEELVLAACPITTQSMLDNCTQGSTCKQMTHQTRCLVT